MSFAILGTLFFYAVLTKADEKCSKVWSKGVEITKSEFINYINRSETDYLNRQTWKWDSDSGSWEVFYNDWAKKGIKSGGFYFYRPNRQRHSYAKWRLVDKNLLTWSSDDRKLPFETWNLTLCKSDIKITFEPSKTKWHFHLEEKLLGNIRIQGGESGKMFVNENFFSPSYKKMLSHLKKHRHRRDEPDAEKIEDTSLWNKLKGYFKELFDQGPEDQRGWLTRIADWLLGFLERLLS